MVRVLGKGMGGTKVFQMLVLWKIDGKEIKMEGTASRPKPDLEILQSRPS
jgi:hypothetical protein